MSEYQVRKNHIGSNTEEGYNQNCSPPLYYTKALWISHGLASDAPERSGAD
jgi:hypothetical protein